MSELSVLPQIQSASTGASASRSSPAILRHARKALQAAGFALLPLLTLATTAEAQLPQVGLSSRGGVEPVGGYPLYYEDANGLRLQLCQDPNVCLFALPNPALPLTFPTNFPDEQFYWAVAGDMAGTGGASVFYENALEAAFLNGVVVQGEQAVFTRFRLRANGLQANTAYQVTWPYGTQSFTTSNLGEINFTDDVGFAALQFDLALAGNVGPFLTPVGFNSRQPGVFIADANILVPVQGSPLGTNYFRITGPGVGDLFTANRVDANTAQINLFSLQGQISVSGGVGVKTAYVARSTTETAVNVWATAPVGVALTATADGSTPVAMTALGTTGTYFARVVLPPTSVPTSVTLTNTTDNPPTVFVHNGLTDLVQVRSAVYTVGGTLTVSGFSSDKLNNPVLTLTGEGLAPLTLTPAGSGVGTASVTIPAGTDVPDVVTVTSAQGGSFTAPVSVELNNTEPVVANAGVDRGVNAGATVLLDGSASTGPITSWLWTHDAGALITLNGANTATPSFVAPALSTPTVITLTLTVNGALGQTATDTVVIVVAAVPAVVANAGADRNVAAGAAVTLASTGSTGPITTYAWTHDAGALITLNGANTANPSFTAPSQATASVITFTLTVSGSFGQTSTDTMVVNVAAAAPAVANAGADRTVSVSSNVALSGTASTGTILGYAWTHNAGAAITLNNANTATPSFTAPATATTITFTLTVTGAGGQTSTDTMVVTVQAALDVVRITAATYRAGNVEWRIDGTASLRGQQITVYLGAAGDTTRPVATVNVTATGTWTYRQRGGVVVPPAGDNRMWARSSLGGDSPVFNFTRN